MKPIRSKQTTKPGRGRPVGTTKLTAEVQETIVTAIRQGNYLETAAALAGIHRDTLYSWIRKGVTSPEGNRYRNFSDMLTRAMAWLLERRFPRRWGRREYLETTVTEKPVDEMTDEEIDTELTEILEKAEA